MDTHKLPSSVLTPPLDNPLPSRFLTSTIQVLWQTDAFRKNFRAMKKHTNCQFNACSFCALKSIYPNFQHHKYTGLPPNIVQRAASILQAGSQPMFETASQGLSSILASLDQTLSTPLGEELFGSRIREIVACECGYALTPNPEIMLYLSFSMKRFRSLFEFVQLSENRSESLNFSLLLHQALLAPHTIPCPNRPSCSRKVTPTLELLSSPPLLAVEVQWSVQGNELSEDLCLFLDTMTSSLQSDELLMTDLVENKRKYSLTTMLCLLEGREVCFTFHSARQLWVRTDSDSVKLADGTFSQLLSYMRHNSYLPTLLLYSDPLAATPTDPPPAAVTLPLPVPSTTIDPHRLSNVWEEENLNTSLWEEGNSNFLEHPPQSLPDLSLLTEDSYSYGYLDFGLGSKEAHGGRIDLSGDLSLSPQSDESFQNIQVFVHSPSTRAQDESLRGVELLPPSPESSRHSFPPPQLREHTQRRSSQKRVPSIPTPFALLWQLPMFRLSLQSVKGHMCTLKTCVYCVYQLILERFDYKDIPVVPPELLRRAMAICFEREKGYNLGLSFDDVPKMYEELLARIHYSMTGNQDMSVCTAPHCVTHQKFASSFTLSGECPCGHKLDSSSALELVYSVSAQSLIEETRKVSHGQHEGKEFGQILRDIGAVQDTQPCSNSACKLPLRIQRSLNNRPEVFTISLNWDGLPLTAQNLEDVINSIGVSLRLTDVFSLKDSMLRFRPLYLTAIVARQDLRYAFFYYHSTLRAWYCMDEDKFTTLGDKWPGVLRTLHALSYQAILLVYMDPCFSPLETSTALTESVVCPGAEGERIRRENLFPSISDSVQVHRNRPSSPESVYSSDPELFQWRAGERTSLESESIKGMSSERSGRAAESGSEQDMDENMGTFRVNEGVAGDGRTLFDIISLSPESSKSGEASVLVPPSLWLLRQLDMLGKGLVRIGEHKCDGTLCLFCALIQAQASKDYCFTPAILKPILSPPRDGDKSPTVATYQHLLTRLHNALCRDGQEMRLDDSTFPEDRNVLCESPTCITHQRLSTQLELLQKGGDTIQCTQMVLEVSARDLTQKIKDLNTSTPPHQAGSIRVMRLFAQAARSLLELPGSSENRHISLVNSPDVISFSLRWDQAPDRDEAADFYERISPAVQPQDLFHRTRDPLLSRRVYYLLGIITESPNYRETWVYNQEICSWTHYSGRTHSVTVLGPQLSSVWHNCRSSTSSHKPIFLLYSNPASFPFNLSTPQRNTLTPSQALPQEEIVVVTNQATLTNHFSVKTGIDEALSFFDATLRHQEMLLSPSPSPPPPSPPPPLHQGPSHGMYNSSQRSGTSGSATSDNNVQVSSQSQFTSPLSDCPFSSSLFTQPNKFTGHDISPSPSLSPQSVAAPNEMECAERLAVVLFTLLQMNHFRLSLLQTHDQVIEETPLIALKQIFNIAIAVPHLIPSKFIPVSCQHLGLLSQLNGNTSPDLYIDLVSQLLSRFPLNPFVNYLKQSMLIRVQHKEGTLYTHIVLPVSANRLVAELRSALPDSQRVLPVPKLFSGIIRQMLTYDGTSLSLMSSPDVIPVHLQWNPNVINSPDTEFIVQHIPPALLMKDLFPLVANKFISQRVLYLYGMIVSVNQIQLVIYYTTDIQSWIIYDGTHFEKIGLVWQDVRYFLESNYCRPDILFYLNPTPTLLDASPLQRGLPEISHTKTNPGLTAVAEEILTELFPRDDPTQEPPSLRLVQQDVVRPGELQQMAGSPVRMVVCNDTSNEDVHFTVNAGSLEGLENIGVGSNYESSLHRRQLNRNGLLNGKKISAPSLSSSNTSTFRKEARASYHPFFTSLVALWSIDAFRESLLRLEMQLRTPEYLPLVSRLKQMFSASVHATALTPALDLFQSLSSRLLNSAQFTGSGTQVFDTILTHLRDDLKKSISFQGPDPIEKSRLIQNIFSLTLQQSGKCRCGAIYEPIEFNQNLLHLNLALYLPFAKKTCNKYVNINNVPHLAHKAIRETLVLMNKLNCEGQTCNRTYLASSLLVTAPRVLCLALDYGEQNVALSSLLPALPTSLQVGKLFREIGPNARANSLLYLTGVLAEISQERVLHLYYHTGLRTWVSVDGMGYKDLGIWRHVIEEIEALNAKPSTLFYTNPLDFSHQYQDPALAQPADTYRSSSAPEPSSTATPDFRAERIRILTSSSADPGTSEHSLADPQYVPIRDINIKKKLISKQTEGHKHLSQDSTSSSEDTGSREERNRERPPLPLRLSHSKESLEGIEVTLTKPGSADLSHYSSVSELSALAGLSNGKSTNGKSVEKTAPVSTKTAPGKLTQQNSVKPKSKHKKATSMTLLNKLNPKTYFRKKDKVRIPQVVQTTQEYPPSDLDNTSPRISVLMDTPNLKKDRFTKSEENYNDHLDQLFSSAGMPENTARPHRSPDRKSQQQPAPSFLTPKTFTAENLGRYDQVVQQFKETSPPRQEEFSQRVGAAIPRPRDVRIPRSQRDPFETSLAAHLLLQMINFSPYYHSVLNFCKLRIKKKHQIIQALDALFKRASSHSVNQLDIIEYLNTCMPSMLGSAEFDTGHRLFHQLHWSFQPHSDAFKERYSLQVEDTGRSGGVKEVYFVVTAVSDWLDTFEQSLRNNNPVTHNHKVLREGLRKILPPVCQRICNCPDQFYLGVDYDRDVETVSTWKIWNCIPTLLTLSDLSPLLETSHSPHKPFYLTGIVSRTDTGALASYCYVESRGMWCCYSSNTNSHTSMQHWDELLAHVTTHPIYPLALLYTSSHSQPLFTPQSSAPPLASARTAAPPPVHTASDSFTSSLDKVRYHTLTPHPSVPPLPPFDIEHDLTTQLLSTLLLTPGFGSSFSPPTPQTPFLSEVRSLLSSSLHSFSTRQQPISVFVQRNLRPESGGDNSPSSLYSQLISKLSGGDPALSQKLYLSVADTSGEELLPSVSLSLSAYSSQAMNIPRFSKLNPTHCRIALKSVSSVKKRQIQRASRLICLCCEQERVNSDILSQLPPQLQLSYLGAVSPKRNLQHLSYYLTGLLLSSQGEGEGQGQGVYTSAVYLCPREKWILFKTGSLSEGEEFSWLQLCEKINLSQYTPLFCFYSNESIMGHYSASFASPYMPPLSSPLLTRLTPDMSSPLLSGHNSQQFIYQTTNIHSGMLDLRIGQTDYLGPTTSLTDTNPPPEMLQELFSAGGTSPPFITFPSPPSDTSQPPSILLLPPDIHTYSSLPPLADNPLGRNTRQAEQATPPLFVSAISMLWHLPFFRQAVLLSPGHVCLGYSCPMCALKSLFALHYYSRAYALPSGAISLAHRHSFSPTDSCRSIGELVPAIARMTDECLKAGRYQSLPNFTLEHEQGSLCSFSVPLSALNQNITRLANTQRFRGETHPLLFSKALANTLEASLKLRTIPHVLILDLRGETPLTQAGTLGAQIRLSDLIPVGASCLAPHFYLSSLLAADQMGRTVTFSFHLEFCCWVSYDGHVAGKFPNIQQMTEYLIANKYSLLSTLYMNPVAPRPRPQELPQETTRSVEARGDSATIRRMQQIEEESTGSKSSLYPAIPSSIGFENLLEDYEREKQGVGALTDPLVQTFVPEASHSQNLIFPAELVNPPPFISFEPIQPAQHFAPNFMQNPSMDPSYPPNPPLFAPPIVLPAQHSPAPHHYFHPNLAPAPSAEVPYAATDLTHPLFTPPFNLAYPPSLVQQDPSYPPAPRQFPPPQTGSTTPPNFCFSSLLHSDKFLSVAAVAELAAKLTETGLWKKVFQSIPCLGERYEMTAFEQRQRKTAFNPGKAVLERIQSYQVPMEVLMDTFTHIGFQDGVSILNDPSSYSSFQPSPPSDPPTIRASPVPPLETPVAPIESASSSTSSEEEYDPDPSSVNLAPPPAPESALLTAPPPDPEPEREMSRSEELDEESELLLRRHSEEEASLLNDYQVRMEAQEVRQQREVDRLRRRQLQSVLEFRDELNCITSGQTEDLTPNAPQYVPPPQLVQERIPAFPASFPPTQADMFYTQARDLYRESHNVSDFSVAFSLCVQAQNKLDLALIEPDVRLDPVKKQAFSQLRQICHQQAVKLHRRSVLRTLDPNHQFKSPPKKQAHCKTKRVKFDSKLSQAQLQEEATPSPPPSLDPPPSYTRPILRPPPLTPSLYQSIPRPPPIGRAMKDEEKENQKPDRSQHKMNYPPSRAVKVTQPPTDSPPVSDSRTSTPSTSSTLSTLSTLSTPSTLSTISDDMTSTSSSRTSSRSHRQASSRQLPPSKPFFNEDHYTLLDKLIKCKREDLPPELDHSELSRKLLDSKIHSRSHSVSSPPLSTPSPGPLPPSEGTGPAAQRDYFKLATSEDRSESVVARIDTNGRSLAPEKCSVCRSSKFFTIKGMCPECYTRHVRSTNLMIRTGVEPTDV